MVGSFGHSNFTFLLNINSQLSLLNIYFVGIICIYPKQSRTRDDTVHNIHWYYTRKKPNSRQARCSFSSSESKQSAESKQRKLMMGKWGIEVAVELDKNWGSCSGSRYLGGWALYQPQHKAPTESYQGMLVLVPCMDVRKNIRRWIC